MAWVLALLLASPPAAAAAGEGPAAVEAAPLARETAPQEASAAADEAHAEEHDSGADHDDSGHASSRLSDHARPLALDGFPERPKPLLELGEPFLGTGTLDPGFELPTGAVWQPSLLVFGTLRSAVQSFEADGARVSEWANRLDLFANLALSGSERLVLGLRPLDSDGRFTSHVFESDLPGVEEGFDSELDAEIESLFFEGDFGEIFPNLSRDDFSATDIGFSVGRQPLSFQEGMLIDDAIDAIGLTRNTLQPAGTSNLRATFLWGWNEIGRGGPGGNREDEEAHLLALLTSTDLRRSTVDADLAWVSSDGAGGDLVAGGVSAVQRIGLVNTAFRVLASAALDEKTPFATDGVLLFSEVSWTPHHTHDLVYWTAFAAFDEFSSAARGPASGGPLGRAGINFAAVGLGRYGAALSSRAREVAGGAVGYQRFFAGTRKQVIVELGGRAGLADDVADAIAATARYQAAYGRRFVVVVDGFAGYRDGVRPGAGGRQQGGEELFGGRLELVVKF